MFKLDQRLESQQLKLILHIILLFVQGSPTFCK